MDEPERDGGWMYVGWGLFACALIFGGLCVDRGDAQRVVIPPGSNVSNEQLAEAVDELGMLLKAAGRTPEQIAQAQLDLRCAYRPKTEGCDEGHTDY